MLHPAEKEMVTALEELVVELKTIYPDADVSLQPVMRFMSGAGRRERVVAQIGSLEENIDRLSRFVIGKIAREQAGTYEYLSALYLNDKLASMRRWLMKSNFGRHEHDSWKSCYAADPFCRPKPGIQIAARSFAHAAAHNCATAIRFLLPRSKATSLSL